MTIRAPHEKRRGLRRKDEIHLDGIYSDSTTAKKDQLLGLMCGKILHGELKNPDLGDTISIDFLQGFYGPTNKTGP